MRLWIATGNKGKLAEFKMMMANPAIEIRSQNELPVYSSPPETGKTFLENAQIKARSLKSVVDDADWVLADDSGLCVDGLGGLPGVHSARYAGEKASDGENVAKLLKMMQIRSSSNRKAYFECSLVLISPQRTEQVFTGQYMDRSQPTLRAQKVLATIRFLFPRVIHKPLASKLMP